MANRALLAVESAERRGALFERRVLGYPIWPLERLKRYRTELLEGRLVESTGPSVPMKRRLASMRVPIRQAVRDARELSLASVFDRRDVWVLATSNYRRADEHGVPQCIFAEDVRQQLGERVLFLERTTNDLEVAPRADVMHLDGAHLAAMLPAKAGGALLARATPLDRSVVEAFAPLSASYLYQLALYGHAMERFARMLIARHRPKAVFVVCGYQPFIPFQRAVRAAGIPLIELQHGLIHESHPGYALGDGTRCDHLPDRLVVFGERFARIVEAASPYWRERTRIGGHAWLREKSQGVPPLAERDAIVLFSQTDVPVREAIRQIALDLGPKLRARPGNTLRVIVKPHPRETDAEHYWGALREHGVELAPLHGDSYAILRTCRLAVSVYSTVAVEALAFGCASAVTHDALWTDDIRELVEQQCLLRVDSGDDVLRVLDGQQRSSSSLADELFAINAPPLDYAALIDELASG